MDNPVSGNRGLTTRLVGRQCHLIDINAKEKNAFLLDLSVKFVTMFLPYQQEFIVSFLIITFLSC